MRLVRMIWLIVVVALGATACADDSGGADATTDGSTPIVDADGNTAGDVPSTSTDEAADDGGIDIDEIAGGSDLTLLVADRREIRRVVVDRFGSSTSERALGTDQRVLRFAVASDGTVFTTEAAADDEGVPTVARYASDGTRTEVEVLADVYDTATIDGVEVVIGAIADPDGVRFGGVGAYAIDDLSPVADFGLAAEAEFGVTHFDWSEMADVGVGSAWADLTEWVGFVDTAGDTVTLPSPTDELTYGAPPYVTAATISPDGRTLWWAEGPDWGFDEAVGDSAPVPAAWILQGADLETGAAFLFWPLSDVVRDTAELDIHSIVDLGDRLVINRTQLVGTDSVALAPLILDLTLDEPELYELDIAGIAAAP